MVVKNKLIGERIKELRAGLKITQSELAARANVADSYISLLENGKKQASLEIYITIANALGVTLDELLYGIQENNPSEYQTDMDMILSDCTSFEKKVIYEMSKTLKRLLRENALL